MVSPLARLAHFSVSANHGKSFRLLLEIKGRSLTSCTSRVISFKPLRIAYRRNNEAEARGEDKDIFALHQYNGFWSPSNCNDIKICPCSTTYNGASLSGPPLNLYWPCSMKAPVTKIAIPFGTTAASHLSLPERTPLLPFTSVKRHDVTLTW